MFNLKTTKRAKEDKVGDLRLEGQIPAVVYGGKEESVLCSVALNEFIKVWREAGETGLVELETAGGKKDVMIHEVQKDPVSDVPMHIDFYAVTKGQKIEVNVPLEFVGTAPAIKNLGANLMATMHDIAVIGDAREIPQSIDVSVESLTDLDSQILVKDLVLPAGVEVTVSPDEVVASISAANEEEEEVAPEEVDMSAIEVQKKGKGDEEGEEEVSS